MTARILVTGANGFIGSHLVEHLVRRGDQVIALILTGTDPRSLMPLFESRRGRLRLVVGDLRNLETFEPALEGVEYVYHLGAVLVGTSAAEFRDTNVRGTRNLLEAIARRRPDGLRRFLFASSQAAAGPSPDGRPIEESQPPRPVSWYGESKRDAEAVVREFGTRVPVTTVRPAKVYGEGERGISWRIMPLVRAGLEPRLGLRRKTVSLIHVCDAVEGMIAAAESPRSVGKIYFLADSHPYDQREVVRAIADAMGKRVRLPVVVPHLLLRIIAGLAEWRQRATGGPPALTRDKVRELAHHCWSVTPAAAARDFGWCSRVGLPEGMARAVAYADRQRPGRPQRRRGSRP